MLSARTVTRTNLIERRQVSVIAAIKRMTSIKESWERNAGSVTTRRVGIKPSLITKARNFLLEANTRKLNAKDATRINASKTSQSEPVTPVTKRTTNIRARKGRSVRAVTTLIAGRRPALTTAWSIFRYLESTKRLSARNATKPRGLRMPIQTVIPVTKEMTNINVDWAPIAVYATAPVPGNAGSSITTSRRISAWMAHTRNWSVSPVTKDAWVKRSVSQGIATAVTRATMCMMENLAGIANVVTIPPHLARLSLAWGSRRVRITTGLAGKRDLR